VALTADGEHIVDPPRSPFCEAHAPTTSGLAS
jgi:hypothetical protein